MARTNNLTNFLTDVASAIKEKKGLNTAIPAGNFDTEILALPSQGTYQEKTVTITQNGQTTLTPDTGYDAMDQVEITVNVPIKQLQSKTVSVTSNGNIAVLPDTGYDGFNEVNLEVNVPTGGGINNQDKTITQNGIYVADSGYTGLGTVTVNVPTGGGSGDVKLFETEQAMQADTTAQEGDLAIVYRNEVQPCTVTSHFSKAVFPETVVLDTALEDYVDLRFRAVDDSQMFNCWGNLDSNHFQMNCYGEEEEYRIQYESQDGITYTRTRFMKNEEEISGNEIDFGIEICYEDEEMWNDAIGEFIQVGGTYFEGLYQYHQDWVNTNQRLLPLMSNITVDFTNDIITCDFTNNPDSVNSEKILLLANRIADDNHLSNSVSSVFLDINNRLHLIYSVNNLDPVIMYSLDESEQYPAFYAGTNTTEGVVYTDYILDLENQTYSSSSITFTTARYGSNNYRYYSRILLKTYPIRLFVRMTTNQGSFWSESSNSISPLKLSNVTTVGANTSGTTSSDIWLKEDRYIIASTQLTLKETSQLLPGVIAYGQDGVITGDGSLYENLDLGRIMETYYQLPQDETFPDIYGYPSDIISPYQLPGKLYYYLRDASGIYGFAKNRIWIPETTSLYSRRCFANSDESKYIIGPGYLGDLIAPYIVDANTKETLFTNSYNTFICFVENDKAYVLTNMDTSYSTSSQWPTYSYYGKAICGVATIDLDTYTVTDIPGFSNPSGTFTNNYTYFYWLNHRYIVRMSIGIKTPSPYTCSYVLQVYDTENNNIIGTFNASYSNTSSSSAPFLLCIPTPQGMYITTRELYNGTTKIQDVYRIDYTTNTFTRLFSGKSQVISSNEAICAKEDNDYLYMIKNVSGTYSTAAISKSDWTSTDLTTQVIDNITGKSVNNLGESRVDSNGNVYRKIQFSDETSILLYFSVIYDVQNRLATYTAVDYLHVALPRCQHDSRPNRISNWSPFFITKEGNDVKLLPNGYTFEETIGRYRLSDVSNYDICAINTTILDGYVNTICIGE